MLNHYLKIWKAVNDMREILFKAKRIDNGEWVEGYYAIAQDRRGLQQHNILLADNHFGYYKWYVINPETVCQFTGLHDKNGNKIWENDIVSDGSENRTYKVMYDEENLCLAADNKAFNKPIALITLVKYFSLTVIGSAIDNPELLKGGSE